MSAHRRDPDGVTPTAVLAGLVLVALALRPQITSIGPLSGRIVDDLGISHAFVGLLTTIPVLCMGVFAPLGPAFAGRLGPGRAIAAAAGTVGTVGIIRAIVPGEATLLVLTLAIGIATATAGPMLAMFVRGHLPGHRVAGTSAYASGTMLGQAISVAIVVPLAVLLGGWRPSLAAVSAATLLSVGAWYWLALRGRPAHADGGPPPGVGLIGLPVRRPVVWALGLLFGIQSAVFYGSNAWLPSYFVERGWEPAAAAGLVALASAAGMSAIVAAPTLARRGAERRELIALAVAMITLGIGGVVVLPTLALLWVPVLGSGLGLMFTVMLTLPIDVAADAREAGGASALMLLVGYLIASAAPFALGAVRDATGSFSASLWLLLALAVSMLPLAWALSPERLRPRPAAREAIGG